MGAPNTTPGAWAVEDEPYRHIRAKDGSQGGWGSTVYDGSYYPSNADASQIAASGDLYDALATLLAAVDKMDRRPSNGGGVLPVDKALATGAARTALARARGETA